MLKTQKSINFWHNDYNKKSLNKTYRKKKLIEITNENGALLRRIQEKKSSINFKILDKERKTNEKYLTNISQYRLSYKDSENVNPDKKSLFRSLCF